MREIVSSRRITDSKTAEVESWFLLLLLSLSQSKTTQDWSQRKRCASSIHYHKTKLHISKSVFKYFWFNQWQKHCFDVVRLRLALVS